MAKLKNPPKADPLDVLAAGDPRQVIALMLWRNRHHEPSMTCVLKQEDIDGLRDCVDFLKVTPDVVIVRPAGREAVPAIPPRGNRPGQPALPAEPPRPHVVVALVAKGTMDAIRPLENNDDDAETTIRLNNLRAWREKAPLLAGQLRGAAHSGDTSTAVLSDAADALMAFAGGA